MEVEKRGTKGGLFQLFDWNGKSRKKLFSTRSELPESSNLGKGNFHGALIARSQGLGKGIPPDARGYDDYQYAASSDAAYSEYSEYRTKAPGVVARLMGLDSLPMPNVNETCFNPSTESHSCADSSYLMAAPAFQREHDVVISESVRNKLDGSSGNPLDLKLQKVQSRALERFQTEVLPPKYAKPISITHHPLLSPIKSPGFVPPKNAAYIIEAAAKIIEQSPQSTTKSGFQAFGSPSVPFRIRELKEKMEAAQRSSRLADVSHKGTEQNSMKNMKKQLNTRGQHGSQNSSLNKGSGESKRMGSQRFNSKEKSVSVPAQAKANVQKRDGLTSVCNGSSGKQKERNDTQPICVSRNIPNSQKKVEKQSPSRKPSDVHRLNNKKQNCAFVEHKENFEPSSSHSKERKESKVSANYRQGQMNRTVNKIAVSNVVTCRKTNFVEAEPGKEFSSSRANTTSKQTLPINGNIQSGANVAQKAAIMNDKKTAKCNGAFEGESKLDGVDKKNSLDVVSFTFSSPIKKSGSGSNSGSKILEATCSSFPKFDPCLHESDLEGSAMSSSGFNVIGGDPLSVLLEQKLKELTSRVELSQKDLSETDSSSSSSTNSHGNMGSIFTFVKPLPMDSDTCKSKQEIRKASGCAPIDELWPKAENESKGLEYMKSSEDNGIEYQRNPHLQGSLSVSSQPSLSGASSGSFDVDRSSSNEDRLPCVSLESYEGMNCSSMRKSHAAEDDVETSDTASSLSVGTGCETVSSNLYMTDLTNPSCWELQYIRDILGRADLLSKQFALGQAHKIIPPDLFDQLENQKIGSSKFMEEHLALERKVWFDCVCECLEVRCGQLLAGSCKFWYKQATVLRKSRWLAKDLYREISSWTNAEDLMVDELVDKDMSSKNGKWTDFEIEAFEEGVEIEERILTFLVDELIDDFLF